MNKEGDAQNGCEMEIKMDNQLNVTISQLLPTVLLCETHVKAFCAPMYVRQNTEPQRQSNF